MYFQCTHTIHKGTKIIHSSRMNEITLFCVDENCKTTIFPNYFSDRGLNSTDVHLSLYYYFKKIFIFFMHWSQIKQIGHQM